MPGDVNVALSVMVGLVPAIHVFLHRVRVQDVDARHEAEHDGCESARGETFAAQLVAAALVAPTIAVPHVLVIGAAAIRLVRLAEQAAGAGALRAFAFVVHGDLLAVRYHKRTGWS
jgi:hypothetical protein